MIGPELGLTQPGLTVVCGDSHTSTHGAFGALAFGIGTSEVEHVLATQTLPQRQAALAADPLRRRACRPASRAKDLVLATIGQIGVDGGVGHVIEYAGPAIEALSMEGRMTICNMSIEAGARAGMIAPDETTFAYLEGRARARRRAPTGSARSSAGARSAPTRARASTARSRSTSAEIRRRSPGARTPAWSSRSTARVPDPAALADAGRPRRRRARARVHGARAGHADRARSRVDRVFIGSCTNSRIEDLRAAAEVARGRRVHPTVRAMVVPGSAP